jgi:hypothetical protein
MHIVFVVRRIQGPNWYSSFVLSYMVFFIHVALIYTTFCFLYCRDNSSLLTSGSPGSRVTNGRAGHRCGCCSNGRAVRPGGLPATSLASKGERFAGALPATVVADALPAAVVAGALPPVVVAGKGEQFAGAVPGAVVPRALPARVVASEGEQFPVSFQPRSSLVREIRWRPSGTVLPRSIGLRASQVMWLQ